MQSKAKTPKEYFDTLPEDRREVMVELRKVIDKNLPKGFPETMQYGMPGWVVPHTLYPAGLRSATALAIPRHRLPEAVRGRVPHGGLRRSGPSQMVHGRYAKQAKGRLDMGKSCIRFKKPDQIPIPLIGELASKLTPGNGSSCTRPT